MPRNEQGRDDSRSQNRERSGDRESVYAPDAAPGRLSYQWLLRALGAQLDTSGAQSIMVLEEANGFAVRYQQGPHPQTTVVTRFSTDDLLAMKNALQEQRQFRLLRSGSSSAPDGSDESYQDLLRALGHELDRLKAYSVSIDQIEDALFVSYMFTDARQSFLWTKEATVLPANDRQTLLEKARARRDANEPRRGLFGLQG